MIPKPRALARGMRSRARSSLHRRGWDLHRVSIEPDPLPQLLRKALTTFGIELVIDVGANRGQFGDSLRRMGYGGAITSFEPVPECRAALRQRAEAFANWEVRSEALGDEGATAVPMNVAAWDQLSSLLEPTPGIRESFGHVYGASRIEQVTVARLDAMWDAIGAPGKAVMLKTDAQGYDVRILRGAGEKLRQVRCLLIEVSLAPAYVGNDNGLRQALDYLEDFDFRLAALSPVPGSRGPSLGLTDADAFFVRPSMVGPAGGVAPAEA